jgi:hypothetical protein
VDVLIEWTPQFFLRDYVRERYFTILFEVVSSSSSDSNVRVVDVENRKGLFPEVGHKI